MAVGVLAVAFISPPCALSSALFSARVVHHALLVAVAAPLLARAWPARRAGTVASAIAASTVVLHVAAGALVARRGRVDLRGGSA